MVKKEDLIEELENHQLDIVVTIGAGDIDKEVPKVAEYMKSKFNITSEEDE